ncbi:hypothetical protein D9619_005169 [Psilocybe cf. subviscida]|uniref:F-box domain-containing protein n=1 Tax=Psilocybe cf. subviscida TaxID=2480587 RepID=A0A8H5BWB7_9AGAR|nr:hypothetical protein D9619_005169 [Psilocybe cf. subviscida]
MSDLPEDIFWKIIQLSLDSNALDTLKNLSHVSRSWRALALSPALWAKALDFKELRPKKDIWRAEVLRRTGDCALYVGGSWIPSVIQEFFLHEFLVPNMHRIRALHAHIGLMTNKMAGDPAWYTIFDQPAPILETFSLDFDEDHTQGPPRVVRHALRDGKALFAGQAPALRTVKNDPYLIFNPGVHPTPDWMGNVTTIMLSEHAKTILAVLTRTPRLRRLFLMNSGEEISGLPDVSSVTLPDLRYIYKGYHHPEADFSEIQHAIRAPPGVSVFALFRKETSLPAAAVLLREYIKREKPTKLLLRLPEFRMCDISQVSRRAATDEIFSDASREDFAIDIEASAKPSAFMDAVASGEIDCSSVQEWHLRFNSDSYARCNESTYFSLKALFDKVLWPAQTIVTDKDCYEDLQKREIIPEAQPVRTTKKRIRRRYRWLKVESTSSATETESDSGSTLWKRS